MNGGKKVPFNADVGWDPEESEPAGRTQRMRKTLHWRHSYRTPAERSARHRSVLRGRGGGGKAGTYRETANGGGVEGSGRSVPQTKGGPGMVL